jgi:glycerophosphoryl diester phosphodiesterase
MRPQVWAHRGACHEAPENTLSAFEQAIRLGADGVELDVQRTADGVLVVTHDETCTRLAGLKAQVNDLDWQVLRALNFAHCWPNWPVTLIPSLVEVLDLFRPTSLMINLELKNSKVRYPGLERQVIDLVAQFNLEEQVIFSSFNHASMKRVHALAPAGPTGLLYSKQQPNPWALARRYEASALHPSDVNLAIPGLIDEAHHRGLKVHVWTVDSLEQWRRCAELGVDAVITNQPREALAFFKAFKA